MPTDGSGGAEESEFGRGVWQPASLNVRAATTLERMRGGESGATWGIISLERCFPAGETPRHSISFGINYANYYANGECHLFDTPPDCLLRTSSDELAYTSVGSILPSEADLPPCARLTEGMKIVGDCDENKQRLVKECRNNKWHEYKESCGKPVSGPFAPRV